MKHVKIWLTKEEAEFLFEKASKAFDRMSQKLEVTAPYIIDIEPEHERFQLLTNSEKKLCIERSRLEEKAMEWNIMVDEWNDPQDGAEVNDFKESYEDLYNSLETE